MPWSASPIQWHWVKRAGLAAETLAFGQTAVVTAEFAPKTAGSISGGITIKQCLEWKHRGSCDGNRGSGNAGGQGAVAAQQFNRCDWTLCLLIDSFWWAVYEGGRLSSRRDELSQQ